jgi:serine/threonine-protein kinase
VRRSVTGLLERFRSAIADRYAIERELGQGGMATVYLAVDLKHRRRVALKVLRPDLGAAVGGERFQREIEISAGLTHPHILPLHDSGEAAGFVYYVMPYIEGESVRDRLRREPQLPLEEALRITREVADALACAHASGVVHRDIKPENILLKSGHAYVTDFGIARALHAAGAENLTRTGMALGTPAYMSPEQITGGQDVDGRSDVYSLALVLYEMLAGTNPVSGPNAQEMFARRFTGQIPSLRSLRDIPESVDAAVARALARTPADRFSSAEEFTEALGSYGSRRDPARRPRPRRRAVAIVMGFAAIAAASVYAARSYVTREVSVSAARVAVLPFAVRAGGNFAYLAEGMVDLLSRNLDGAGELQTVDPGTIFAAIGGDAGSALDPARGRTLARKMGAGLFILGSVNAIGREVRLQAALYDASPETDSAQATGAVGGDSTQLFSLVDQLSKQLMVRRGRGLSARLSATAAITTSSLPALKAYLDGERRLRSASLQVPKLDSAIALFQQAVNEDSTFALAHYRKAVAAGWANRHAMSTSAATRALTLADRLSPRDRRLLAAYVDYRRGAAADAERRYREILRDYPDDLEAAFQLADVQYNYNPLRGRPRSEAREAFNHVLEHDPGFL